MRFLAGDVISCNQVTLVSWIRLCDDIVSEKVPSVVGEEEESRFDMIYGRNRCSRHMHACAVGDQDGG